MKKMMFMMAFGLIAFKGIHAQENAIKANPLGFFFGSAQFGYERALGEKSAFQIDVAYTNIKATVGGAEDTGVTGFGAEAKYKLYFSPSREAVRGWYAAPTITYSTAKGTAGSVEGEVTLLAGGVVAGYQWVFGGGDSGFALDLNFGAQYASTSTSGDISSLSIDGFLPRLGLGIGYAW